MEDEVDDVVVEPVMKDRVLVQFSLTVVRSCIMPEDEGLVDDADSDDEEDVTVEVIDVVMVVELGVAEEEVLEEEEDEEDEEEEVVVAMVEEEVEEVEDSVPSFDAPFWTVKVSLTASWPPASIIWIS